MELNATYHKSRRELVIHRRIFMDNWLFSEAKHEETRFTVTIEKTKKLSSNPEKRYYFGCVVKIVQRGMNELGWDMNKDETHHFIMFNFAYKEMVNEETGEVFRKEGRLSKIGENEFWQMIERVAKFSAENLHEIIPLPNEQTEIDFIK